MGNELLDQDRICGRSEAVGQRAPWEFFSGTEIDQSTKQSR